MIELLKQAGYKGGEVLMKYFRHNLNVSEKANMHDIVTQADKESQTVIADYIKQHAKEYGISSVGFMGEEGLSEEGEYFFIIDPLDGTTNFAAGIDYFCISIALAHKGEVIAGIIYDVKRNDMYWSEKGKGAFVNENKLKVSTDQQLSHVVILAHSSSLSEATEAKFKFLNSIFPSIRGYRFLGATALDMAHVAKNVGGAILCTACMVWDVAAGQLIIREAGGEVYDSSGNLLVVDLQDLKKKYTVLAGNKRILDQILDIVRS